MWSPFSSIRFYYYFNFLSCSFYFFLPFLGIYLRIYNCLILTTLDIIHLLFLKALFDHIFWLFIWSYFRIRIRWHTSSLLYWFLFLGLWNLFNFRFLELNFLLQQCSCSKLKEDVYDIFSKTTLKFDWREINIDAYILTLID